MILLDTKFHEAIENTELYKAIYMQVLDTISEHTCCADEGQSYTEKEDGLFVTGKQEAAMFIATFIYRRIKEAHDIGWQSRHKSCGLSKAGILEKKTINWDAFKSMFVSELDKMGIESEDTTPPIEWTKVTKNNNPL